MRGIWVRSFSILLLFLSSGLALAGKSEQMLREDILTNVTNVIACADDMAKQKGKCSSPMTKSFATYLAAVKRDLEKIQPVNEGETAAQKGLLLLHDYFKELASDDHFRKINELGSAHMQHIALSLKTRTLTSSNEKEIQAEIEALGLRFPKKVEVETSVDNDASYKNIYPENPSQKSKKKSTSQKVH